MQLRQQKTSTSPISANNHFHVSKSNNRYPSTNPSANEEEGGKLLSSVSEAEVKLMVAFAATNEEVNHALLTAKFEENVKENQDGLDQD